MVAKKHKSKRLGAAQKYKIQKKVKEHHRKLRKEAKKNPQHSRIKKDPGIPNMLPFRESMVADLQERKRLEDLDKEKRRMSLKALAKDAQKRTDEFNNLQSESNDWGKTYGEAVTSGARDNSKRAYYKEFRKVVEAADVILEVLDARDPLGCRTRQIEDLIVSSGHKRVILVLNKIDLVPREVVENWLKYLRNEFPTVAFKSSTQNQRQNLSRSSVSTKHASENLLQTSECLGADNLMKLLKNYCRNSKIKTNISVGVVGFPNVGKSSVINSLKRSKVCGVGSTPGLTKSTQEIHLDKNIKLIDSPGIVFGNMEDSENNAEVLLRNCVKVELIEDPVSAVELILAKCDRHQIIKLYNCPWFESVTDFLIHIARQRGRIRRGGVPDIENAARSILQDWNSGRIPFYTVPPSSGIGSQSQVASAIVEGWSQEFELPELVAVEGKQIEQVVKSKGEMNISMLTLTASKPTEEDMDLQLSSEEEEEMSDVEELEEMSNVSSDNDDMSEDEIIATTHMVRQPKTKKNTTPVVPVKESLLNDFEKEVNPQMNQNLKKLQKQKRKNQRRANRESDQTMVEEKVSTVNEAYQFEEYFPATTKKQSMVGELNLEDDSDLDL